MQRLKIDDETHAQAKVAARKNGMTLQGFTINALQIQIRLSKAAEGFTRKKT
jgi:predicted HicB family RNase H-like nuclease